MKICLDGRLFQGTPKQIVQQMRSIAFGAAQGASLAAYLTLLTCNLDQLYGVTVDFEPDATDADKCEVVLRSAITVGLAKEV